MPKQIKTSINSIFRLNYLNNMKNKTLKIIGTFALVMLLCTISMDVLAQCPMCKASVESSLASGSSVAAGLNKGILYLLLMPYLLYAGIFTAWYFSRKKTVASN